MKVLVVDDQSYVVEGIVVGIAWDRIGIEQVYKAYSGSQAMEEIKKNKIDIVVLDIEMPIINGMELAEWIKSYNEDIAIIFLTSHADFEYAQQAIRIGCYDYIIQPVDYKKLEEGIQNVIQQLYTKNDREDLYGNGLKWKSMQAEIVENFWNKVVLRKPHMNIIQIEEESRKIGLALNWQEKYRLALIKVLNQNEALDQWLQNHTTEALLKLSKIIINENIPVAQFIQLDDVSVLYIIKDCDMDHYFRVFVDMARQECQSNIACYISETGEIEELAGYKDELDQLDEQNVVPYAGIFYRNISLESETGHNEDLPTVNEWYQYLRSHEEDKLLHELRFLMEKKKVEGKINAKTLMAVQQILLHAYYMAMKAAGREIPDIIEHEEILRYYVDSSKSLQKLYKMAEELTEINKTIPYGQGEEQKSEDIIQKIKEYIAKNMDHELSRQEIADYVFVSKDYISHLFKNREGINLIDYINEQKIKMAEHLLDNTKIPINMVAMKVGFPNYCYFSKLFKKSTGMSATEYRERAR